MKIYFLPFVILAALFSGCETSYRSSPVTGWAYNAPGSFDKKEERMERVVIYRASISLAVKNIDSTNNLLTRVANKYGGYVLTMGNEESVIRVKAASLKDALNEICTGRKPKKKTITGDDVSDDYYDSKIRIENSYKARQRYLELLAKAENVEAALKVEVELERLNKEIDVLEGRIKRLEHLAEFSTITVKLEKKVKPGILGYVFIGVYKGIKWLFVRN